MLWCRCKRSRRVRVCSGDKGGGKWIEQVWAKWIEQAGREQVQQQRLHAFKCSQRVANFAQLRAGLVRIKEHTAFKHWHVVVFKMIADKHKLREALLENQREAFLLLARGEVSICPIQVALPVQRHARARVSECTDMDDMTDLEGQWPACRGLWP